MNQRINMLKILTHFYKACISPIFEYANFALLSANETTLSEIQKNQNKAHRNMPKHKNV
jgi:hypothetical protein